jgi:hypothetical protein
MKHQKPKTSKEEEAVRWSIFFFWMVSVAFDWTRTLSLQARAAEEILVFDSRVFPSFTKIRTNKKNSFAGWDQFSLAHI